jgi:hypothetical protein
MDRAPISRTRALNPWKNSSMAKHIQNQITGGAQKKLIVVTKITPRMLPRRLNPYARKFSLLVISLPQSCPTGRKPTTVSINIMVKKK